MIDYHIDYYAMGEEKGNGESELKKESDWNRVCEENEECRGNGE